MFNRFLDLDTPLYRRGYWWMFLKISLVYFFFFFFSNMLGYNPGYVKFFVDIYFIFFMNWLIFKRFKTLEWDTRVLIILLLSSLYVLFIELQKARLGIMHEEIKYFFHDNAKQVVGSLEAKYNFWQNLFELILKIFFFVVGIFSSKVEQMKIKKAGIKPNSFEKKLLKLISKFPKIKFKL